MNWTHITQFHDLNTIVKMLLSGAHVMIPSVLKPVGRCCSDGKRSDGDVIITPWQAGQILVWDDRIEVHYHVHYR